MSIVIAHAKEKLSMTFLMDNFLISSSVQVFPRLDRFSQPIIVAKTDIRTQTLCIIKAFALNPIMPSYYLLGVYPVKPVLAGSEKPSAFFSAES